MQDNRYRDILRNITYDNSISFQEKILLGTSRNKLIHAFFDGKSCDKSCLSHLGKHLISAEFLEHTEDVERFLQKEYECLATIDSLMLKFNIFHLSERYHYNVYNNILEKLSHGSGSEITCSLRLSAAAIMYLTGD